MLQAIMPFLIALIVTTVIYTLVPWWGFWIIFPWIGLAISIGSHLMKSLPRGKKTTGRRITLLLIMPLLLFFIPIINNENFQLEGIIMNIMIGYFAKSFIHLAIAKLFGPLIWGRAFCGWACWTAAILEWLPLQDTGKIPPELKRIRYLSFLLTLLLPLILVFAFSYDIRNDYINKNELTWMMLGNALYYIVAIVLAYIFKDRRAFCKIACPVAVVMEIPSKFRLLTVKPSGKTCIGCSQCNRACPMDVDVMSCIQNSKPVRSTECIQCSNCVVSCPVEAIK